MILADMEQQANFPKLQPVRNLLVCLDLTVIDPFLISYAAFMAKTLPAEQVTFFHAIQAYDLPDRADRDFPDVETDLNAIIRKEMQKSVDELFEEKCRWEVATQVGYEDAAEEIIAYIQENSIDMTLVGQKSGENRKARYSGKIASEAASDILFVPQHAKQSIDPILCAVDFSNESLKAFERGLDLSRTWGVQMSCHFIFDPTRAYFPATTGRSSSYNKQQAKKIQEQLFKAYDLSPDSIPCHIEIGEQMRSEAENIYHRAEKQNARLIVVGAQGDTTTVTSLLGNLSETFRIMEKAIPVMIVKHQPRKTFSWLRKMTG